MTREAILARMLAEAMAERDAARAEVADLKKGLAALEARLDAALATAGNDPAVPAD